MDELARDVIEADGRFPVYGHGLGHGIGLATHELPGLGRRSPDEPLPRRTVFSVEPGIYIEGETGGLAPRKSRLPAASGVRYMVSSAVLGRAG